MRFQLGRWLPSDLGDLARIGRDHDGGYVVSTLAVDAAQVLLGLGINDDWSFEQDFVRRNPAVTVIGVDGSVSAEHFVGRARSTVRRAGRMLTRLRVTTALRVLEEARGWRRTAREFEAFFSAPDREFRQEFLGTGRLEWRALLATIAPDRRLFVKMDIEGAEYEIIPAMLADHARITGCVIEFHDCGDRWPEFEAGMDALARHFVIAHVHGNNYAPLVPGTRMPSVLEVSLVHRSLVAEPLTTISPDRLPRPGLDMPNYPVRDEHILPF
jgi:hypothetical protein